MELVILPFAGDQLDAVVELTRPGRDHSLVLLGGMSAWAALTGKDPAPLTGAVVPTAVRDLTVISLDLRRTGSLSNVASWMSDGGADIAALRDSPEFSRKAIASLIKRLHRRGVPVAFFTEERANLGEIADADPTLAVIAGYRDMTVVGVPRETTIGEPTRIYRVDDARNLRIRDVVASLDFGSFPAGSRWMEPEDRMSGPPVGSIEPQGGPYHGGAGFGGLPWDIETLKPWAALEEARSVNTLVVMPGREDPAIHVGVSASYEVLLNIGPRLAGSLLPEPDAVWPEEQLPDGDLELRAVLTMDGLGEPLVASFTLPAAGPSSWVRFPITTPSSPRLWTGELVIYYQVVPVHAQQLVLPVGLDESPHARLLHRLTRSFADLGPLSERTASMLVGSGGSRVLVNGLQFADNPASISADAANGASRSVRQQLYDLHLSTDSKGRVSPKLNSAFGKDAKQFEADLLTLARLGWAIFDRLFHGNPCFDTLPAMIRSEASARQRVPVLNVADPTMSDPDRDPPLPWSLVYDLPLTQTGDYQVCESVREFGPGGSAAAIPAGCPHESTHAGYTLCPFGFWGLSCVIEQPASSDRLTWNVLDRPQPAELAVAVDPALDGALTRTHLDRLRTSLPPATVAEATVTSGDQLAAMLAGETMDVVYLYCHGGYYQLSTQDKPTTVLQFDKSRVHPADIAAWRANRMLWPPPHWPHRKPLVVLNGCHTVELTTATLGNFVDAFTNRAGASGVIGTEVTVEQGMAGWVVEELLHGLIASGASAGEALRDIRWRMINRGNVMGLAYTLYCVAGLRLRPPA